MNIYNYIIYQTGSLPLFIDMCMYLFYEFTVIMNTRLVLIYFSKLSQL